MTALEVVPRLPQVNFAKKYLIPHFSPALPISLYS